MISLQDAIEDAMAWALDEGADQYVICCDGEWRVVHSEDLQAYASGVTGRFLVHADGVDPGHIERGEISETWEIPEVSGQLSLWDVWLSER